MIKIVNARSAVAAGSKNNFGRAEASVGWLLAMMFLLWRCALAGKNAGEELRTGLSRHIRSLAFPQGSGMGIFFAIGIPIDVPDRSVSVSFYFEANYGMPAINSSFVDGNYTEQRSVDRRMVYDVIQNKLESHGYSGRACLLRTICESAKFPFAQNGLVGDLLRIVFTPSSTQKENLGSEIEDAEKQGDCAKLAEKCPLNLLDVISHSSE